MGLINKIQPIIRREQSVHQHHLFERFGWILQTRRHSTYVVTGQSR